MHDADRDQKPEEGFQEHTFSRLQEMKTLGER